MVSAALLVTLLAAGLPDAAGCAGPVIAVGRVGEPAPTAEGVAIRPALGLTIVADAGRLPPRGVVLQGVMLPAAAGEPAARRLEDRLDVLSSRPEVTVRSETTRLDRRGRLSGHVELADGQWLQAALVAEGLVVATGEGDCAAKLLAVERSARSLGHGLWNDGRLPLTARTLETIALPDYVVFGDRVASVGTAGSTTYLNFGGHYSQDATLRLVGRISASFKGEDAPLLRGRQVLARGWAGWSSGPDLPLSDPLALDIIGDGQQER